MRMGVERGKVRGSVPRENKRCVGRGNELCVRGAHEAVRRI